MPRSLVPGFLLAAFLLGAPGFAQCQLQKLTAEGGQTFDGYGGAVAISDEYAAVGSFHETANSVADAGAVYVYRRTPAGLVLDERVTPTSVTLVQDFGQAVAIDGETLVVGNPDAADLGDNTGAVFVFERGPSGWTETARLLSSDAAAFREFGISVDISGGRILVGASGGATGTAYVFDQVLDDWRETAILKGFDVVSDNSRFGEDVALDGDVAVVGARTHPHPNGSTTGAAFVFRKNGDQWPQTKLQLWNGSQFGSRVDIEDERVLVSSNWPKSAFVYDFAPGSGWQLTQGVSPPAGLGASGVTALALDGNRMYVGGALDDVPLNNAGRVIAYGYNGTSWSFDTVLTAGDLATSYQIGADVDARDGVVLAGAIGADGDSDQSGGAYTFAIEGGEATSFCSATANSSGTVASIGSSGPTSLTTNGFQLQVTRAAPNQYGLFFYGASPAEVPFGDGWLCVGSGAPGIFRLGPAGLTDGVGSAVRPLDVRSGPPADGAGEILPGSTWYFQFYYRDGGASSATGFNLTDGLRVTFCP